MPPPASMQMSRRERQIMDIVYARGQATAAEVLEALPDPPSYSSVRSLLAILERKGYLSHARVGHCYRFSPTVPRDDVGPSMLQRVMCTFFGGSVEKTVAVLLDSSAGDLTPEKYDDLARLIEQARTEGR